MKVSNTSIILSVTMIMIGAGCVQQVQSFSPVHHQLGTTAISTTSSLSYTIVQGIEPEEQDEEARELVVEMMSHRKTEHGEDQYAGYDATKSEQDTINHQLNVDSFSNTIAGGIIPGIQLTSLCADDWKSFG